MRRDRERKRPDACVSAIVSALCLIFGSLFSSGQEARAHPYLFIDVEAVLVVDAPGRLTEIRASLSMNETDSLYIASEYGLNPDGPLTPEQSKFLFELYAEQFAKWNWVTHVFQNDRAVALAKPKRGSARMKDAVLTIDWTVPLKTPIKLDAAPILLLFFEPTFYAEAIVKSAPKIEGPGGRNCEIRFTAFEPTAETKQLRLALSLVPPDVTPDDPMVGRRFADRTEVHCADV